MADIIDPLEPTKKGSGLVDPLEEKPPKISEGKTIWQGYKNSIQDVGRMAKNTPASAYNFASNIITPLISPIKTAKSFIGLVKGGIDELVPGTFPEDRPYAEALAKGMMERYGGWEQIHKTMVDDPVGFMADLSTVITGVGGVASKVGRVGQGITETGRLLEPVNIAKQVAKLPMKFVSKEALNAKSERLYSSALKGMTGEKWPLERRSAAIKQGLEEEITVSKKGNVKLNDAIDLVNDKIAQKIDSLPKGTKISEKEIVKALDELDEFYSHYPSYKFQDELAMVKDQFLNKYRGGIPADEAQRIKQTIYAIHRKHYGELKGAEIEGNKALAHGIREQFIKYYPELNELGYKEKELIDLDRAMEAALKRMTNKDIVGIGTPIVTTAAAAVTGRPSIGAIAWVTRYVIDNPIVKSKLAIAVHKAQDKVRISKKATTARQALFETGQMNQFEELKGSP